MTPLSGIVRGQDFGDPVSEAEHGTRAGGTVGSAAPAGTHEAGARSSKEIARTSGRGRERSANQLRLETIIGIFTQPRRIHECNERACQPQNACRIPQSIGQKIE